ncbi:MAG: hypothetical protein IT370_08370 [Deltaproteobacteria bacterium]|nr:hypothetical protein [Deltaproteobacteria bacterium]
MRSGTKTFSARPLATVRAAALPWRAEGLLVLVEHARGMLRWETRKLGPEGTQRSLVLGETPLLVAQADEYWCPTCEKLLGLGLGRDNVEQGVLDALRQVSNLVHAPLASALETMSPLLELLEDGVYLVSRVPHHPTNGEGLPFWALSRRPQRLTASRDSYYFGMGLFALAPSYPAFLLPTEALARCDWSRVEEYRRQLRSGQDLGALAFWAEGFLSALLDGHHRATACLLEGAPITCLTVMRQGAVDLQDGDRALIVWDERIPFATLPQEAVRLLEAQARPWTMSEGAPAGIGDEEPAEPWTADPRWHELSHAARRFPATHAVAALEIVGETSDERIERLFAAPGDDAPELWLILQALIAAQDPRAVRLALRAGRSRWPDLWDDAFRFLATVRAQEVEDFFIDFLVHDEGQHPWLERIANDYLAQSAP